MIKLFHYTSEAGAEAITSSGFIKGSTGKLADAVYGDGVYLTSLDFNQHSKSKIAANNYDDATLFWESQLQNGKVDKAICIYIPEDEVKKQPDARDIWLYKGDLYLKKYKHEILSVDI